MDRKPTIIFQSTRLLSTFIFSALSELAIEGELG